MSAIWRQVGRSTSVCEMGAVSGYVIVNGKDETLRQGKKAVERVE